MRHSLVTALLASSCFSAGNANNCTPGSQQACACASGGVGAQTCKGDGSGFGTCLGCLDFQFDFASISDGGSAVDMTDQCDDGIQDGDETDVDCGGSTCLPCAVGKMCIVSNDCTSAKCIGNFCSNGSFSFAAPAYFATGATPTAIAAGDFNRDGKLDVATGNFGSNGPSGASLLLGDGKGGLTAPSSFGGSETPNSFAVGDLNNDKKLDVAVAGFNSTAFALGNGDGSFQPVINVGINGSSLAVGDLNNDGQDDVVRGFPNGGGIGTWLSNGGTNFMQIATYNAADISALVIGDVNKDGNRDVAAVHGTQASLGIFLGAGNAKLQPEMTFSVGMGANAIILGDFNGDGKPDAAVTNHNDNNVSVLIGNGDGTFKAAVSYSAGTGPYAVTTADFNLDGVSDLAIADGDGKPGVSILLGKLAGSFQAVPVFFAVIGQPRGIVSGDFNGDGKIDLAVANGTANNVAVLTNKSQ